MVTFLLQPAGRFFAAMVLLLVIFSGTSEAQRASTAIEGMVTDSSGAIIQGATVTLVSKETSFTRTTVSNEAGSYSIPDLPPGLYDITAEARGFKKALAKDVRLYVGLPVQQNLRLEVGEVTEQVSVTAAAPLLRQTTAELGTVIEGKALTEIPLNGRNFLQLNLLSPGAIRSKNSNTFDDVQINPTAQSFNINGQRGDYNVYLLDGVSIKEYQHGSNTFSPNVDAVQEFNQASSNYSAGFGAEAGAQVNLVTKSGSNQFHGGAYEFLRNNKLDARNFFEQSHEAPPFRRNQFGANTGGPVLLPRLYNGKDKTFFFASYEGFRESKDVPLLGNFPTTEQLHGNLSALVSPDQPLIDPLSGQPFSNNQIPVSRIPSTLLPFLENGIGNGPWLPTPNSTTPGFNYFLDSSRRFDDDQVVARIDQRLGSKMFLYGRYAYNRANLLNPNLNSNYTVSQKNNAHSVAVHLTDMFRPSLIGEFTFGYSRFLQNEPASTVGQYDITNKILQIQGLATGASSWGAPGWSVTGFSQLGQGGSLPRLWNPQSYEFRPALNWIRGSHNLKFGGDLTRFVDTFREIIGPNGDFSFDGRFTHYPLGDFLLGLPSGTFFSPEPFDPQQRYSQLGAYIQDDWRVTSRLTLNLGMRYEWSGVPYSSNRTMSNIYFGPNHATPVIVVSEGAKGIEFEGVHHDLLDIAPYVTANSVGLPDSLAFSDKTNLGPRFGFAYSLPGVSNTVLRGGYGWFYQRDTENKFVDMALNPPFVSIRSQAYDETNISTFDWFNPAANTSIAGVGLFANDPYVKNGRIQAWNLALEHSVWSTLFSAAYVGNVSHHLSNLEFPNQARPGPGAITSRRPWPDSGLIYYQNYNGNANYNGLQLKVQRNFTNGFMLLAGYTWSKTIDDTGGTFVGEGSRGFVVQDALNRHADRGLAAQDVRHRLVVSYVYELPVGRGKRFLNRGGAFDAVLGGWQVNGVTTYQTGSPLFITQACNRSNTDVGDSRPDVVGNPKLPDGRSSGDQVNEFFNTSAFVNVCPGENGPFTFGNSGRNNVIGPGVANWDFGMFKEFRLKGESTRLQFRSEFFNLFNHPIFAQPGRTAGTPQFGRIAGTSFDPREIQFALKLYY
jgi:hypothetical protein